MLRNVGCRPSVRTVSGTRLALLRIGEVAEFAVSRPGGMLTVRAEMAERELGARSR
jgi:hypothetical protein